MDSVARPRALGTPPTPFIRGNPRDSAATPLPLTSRPKIHATVPMAYRCIMYDLFAKGGERKYSLPKDKAAFLAKPNLQQQGKWQQFSIVG